jgi:hypothetical protein
MDNEQEMMNRFAEKYMHGNGDNLHGLGRDVTGIGKVINVYAEDPSKLDLPDTFEGYKVIVHREERPVLQKV